MNRIWWFIAVIVFGGIVFGIYTYFYVNYPVISDATNPKNYPMVPWSAVVDGRLARSIARQVKSGNTIKLPDAAVPVLGFSRVAEIYRENMGVDRIEIDNSIVKSPLYKDVVKRPFVTVAYYQTKIKDETYYLMIQQWKSQDGSESYIPLILPDNKVTEGEGLTEYYRKLVDPVSPYFFSPVFYFYNQDLCKRNMGGRLGYCEWLFSNKGRLEKYQKLMEEWVSNGVVPGEMGKYPAYVMVTPLYREGQ